MAVLEEIGSQGEVEIGSQGIAEDVQMMRAVMRAMISVGCPDMDSKSLAVCAATCRGFRDAIQIEERPRGLPDHLPVAPPSEARLRAAAVLAAAGLADLAAPLIGARGGARVPPLPKFASPRPDQFASVPSAPTEAVEEVCVTGVAPEAVVRRTASSAAARHAALLDDRSSRKARLRATEALGKMGDEAKAFTLELGIRWVSDPDKRVRDAAETSLRQIGVSEGEVLVCVLEGGTDEYKGYAAETVAECADEDDERGLAIAQAGAVPPLVRLLINGDTDNKVDASWALATLANINKDNCEMLIAADAVQPLVDLLHADDSYKGQANSACVLNSLACESQERAALVASCGGIPPLVRLLSFVDGRRATSAACALANLAEESPERSQLIVGAGGIKPLVDMLRLNNPRGGQADAACALANMCEGSQERAAAIHKAHAVKKLIAMVKGGDEEEDRAYAALCLSNLADGSPERAGKITELGAVVPLAKLLKSDDEDAVKWAGKALSMLKTWRKP
mmetsp:Transcript_20987/g.65021  ORF Transcript_20987/g.65021 Transcript_20987/m.65021 type:complete len:510 (-) Transcript_20987:104-1633(-)|eukprot:CAMPEP_0119186292 /NCGR_PEP_ID=MMETSP1315-20130426/68946_1 /TAXON_ID=676789 /ORGANISM="Prasinoderma singularis, Strain RCC927" /LENGTH=509 /DNA_ID=CAMNT_0007180729 /DNA_START=1048 /DNA_END=2577 /DNA_ORIENTATION=+